MDDLQLTNEEIETELTQEITFHTIYSIICLYHLKPSKNIKNHYKKLPIKIREDFEKTSIDQGFFERTNNTIEVTIKGVDFLMENILAHADAMMNSINTLKEITETYDEDEYNTDDDDYTENEDNKENKLPSKNIKRQEKRKQKRQQNQNKI